MTLYTASQIAEVVGLNKKHVWRDVRYHGIEPGKVRGVLVLDKKQLDAYMKAKAVKPQPVSKPKKAKPKAQITLTQRSATDAELAANREKIAAQQADKVKPVVLSTTSAPAWWGPFGAKGA